MGYNLTRNHMRRKKSICNRFYHPKRAAAESRMPAGVVAQFPAAGDGLDDDNPLLGAPYMYA